MSYKDYLGLLLPKKMNSSEVLSVVNSQKGKVNGIASLDGSGKVPSSQLPSYVDDVLEFNELNDFPLTGQSGKIYLDKDTNKIYRWSGSQYIEITSGSGSSYQYIADGTSQSVLLGNINENIASGLNSVAEGNATTAEGYAAHAEGQETIASGPAGHAEGLGTIAEGTYSHAEGEMTQALSYCAHAEGLHTTATAYQAHAEGSDTLASGEISHAEGSNTIAVGNYSHAEGNATTAGQPDSSDGQSAHAEGQLTYAKGTYSHTEGYGTYANGQASHAQGSGTTAASACAHAEGCQTHAYGDYSHAGGLGTIATEGQTVIGQYNATTETTPGQPMTQEAVFIIGNGFSESDRSDAFAIKQDGTLVFANGTEITPAQFAQLKALLS